MVLTRKVGTERPYPLVLLLYIVTFTVYGYYWWFKAHDEVYKQFELGNDGREQGVLWLVLGVLFYPLIFVHLAYFVANVEYVRKRLGFPQGITTAGFLGLAITGSVLTFAALLSGVIAVSFAQTLGQGGAIVGGVLGSLAGLFLVASVVLLIIAYARLQGDINGIWHGYLQRMQELIAPEPDDLPAVAAGP